ncbi:MAG TPA: OmpA family protein [Bacteroidetes bacterium]|nr:OmpA family protein [Bacteroidota bacterium]
MRLQHTFIIMKKIISVFLLFAAAISLHAQDEWEIGIHLGYSNYLGDLVEPSFTFGQANFAGGAWLRYHLTDNVKLRSNLILGKLAGDDANYARNAARAASFENNFMEGAILGEYELFGHKRWDEDGKFVGTYSPYVFGGLGLNLMNPKVRFGSDSPAIRDDLRADYPDFQFIIPVGAGFKADLSRRVTVGLEIGMRIAFTDYLDGVSIAGDSDDRDAYFSGSLMVGYLIGDTDMDNDGIADNKDKCPELPGPARYNGCPDTDNDGLIDTEDECPNLRGSTRMNGCPDSDSDGIADYLDDCPNDAGIRRFGGCPDTDNDGIVDLEDNCPNEAGIPSLNGCPDADRDGIKDSQDECPLEPGRPEANGCPDRDNDGVSDKNDKCPDLAGKPAFKGCPSSDKDEDGVADMDDSCPELPGPADNNGCPEIKKEDKKILKEVMSNVRFETGSDVLLNESLSVLDQVVSVMKKYKGYKLAINGHTDSVGDPEKNRQLSLDRAKACYDYLFSKGINPTLMTYTGYGDTQPIADNMTEEGRMENRRVEFVLSSGN